MRRINRKHSRRSLLRGISLGAGGMLLQPILRELEAHAAGAQKMPVRLVFLVQSHGLQDWAVRPAEISRPAGGIEKCVDRPLKSLTLPDDLAPLRRYQEQLTIVQGLNGHHVFPYHGGPYGALGGFLKGRMPAGQTVDAALAEAHAAVFPLLALGVGSRANAEYCSSSWGANRAAPVLCNPEYAFKVLFGSVLQGADRADFDARTSLLNFMREDVKRVRRQLAGPERERLDSYIAAYEMMSNRQRQLRELEDTLRKVVPNRDRKYSEGEEALHAG